MAALRRPGRFLALYAGWIALCAILLFALRGVEDPSRRRGRILSNDAGAHALSILRQRDAARYRAYEVVHVAYTQDRWVVLCDRVPHTALKDAVVVELRAEDGRLLAIRKPVN